MTRVPSVVRNGASSNLALVIHFCFLVFGKGKMGWGFQGDCGVDLWFVLGVWLEIWSREIEELHGISGA